MAPWDTRDILMLLLDASPSQTLPSQSCIPPLCAPNAFRITPSTSSVHSPITSVLLDFAEVVENFRRREHTEHFLVIDHPNLDVVF